MDQNMNRALLGAIFGGKGAAIASVVGGVGTTAFRGHQKITLNSGLEVLIRTTGR